jgi:hypothetical protein
VKHRQRDRAAEMSDGDRGSELRIESPTGEDIDEALRDRLLKVTPEVLFERSVAAVSLGEHQQHRPSRDRRGYHAG